MFTHARLRLQTLPHASPDAPMRHAADFDTRVKSRALRALRPQERSARAFLQLPMRLRGHSATPVQSTIAIARHHAQLQPAPTTPFRGASSGTS